MPFFNQASTSRANGSRNGRFDICAFCKPRKDGGSIHKSCKRPTASDERSCYAKLSKPPKVKSRKLPTARRLQKRLPYTSSNQQQPSTIYILQFEAYPYNTVPAVILGVFSNIDTVTAGAISHGAYAFSREGLHDGSEYLSPTGRIRIFSEEVQQSVVKAAAVAAPRQGGYIPHSDRRIEAEREDERRPRLFLAIRQVSSKTSCIGFFTEKIKAWTACVKDQAMMASSESLLEETRWSDEKGMPYIRGKIEGNGSLLWFVGAFEVDRVVQ